MKKFTLLFLLTSFGLIASAQTYVDISADEIVLPTELRTYEDGAAIKTEWPIDAIITNHGPADVEIGDTVVWAARLTDKVSGAVKTDVPGGGRVYAWVLDRKINAGDTAHFVFDFSLTGGLAQSKDYTMMFYCAGYTGAYIRDTISENNTVLKDIVWYNINGWNVSLNNTNFTHNVTVSPNPANQELNIQLLEINFTTVTLEVYDITGKLVKSVRDERSFEDNSYTLETSELHNGVYFLRVIDGEEISTTKFVVAH